MKEKINYLQMDSMVLHHSQSKEQGNKLPSLKDVAPHIAFDSDSTFDSGKLLTLRMSTPSQNIEFSPSDVSFLASISRCNFEHTLQSETAISIKEG